MTPDRLVGCMCGASAHRRSDDPQPGQGATPGIVYDVYHYRCGACGCGGAIVVRLTDGAVVRRVGGVFEARWRSPREASDMADGADPLRADGGAQQ